MRYLRTLTEKIILTDSISEKPMQSSRWLTHTNTLHAPHNAVTLHASFCMYQGAASNWYYLLCLWVCIRVCVCLCVCHISTHIGRKWSWESWLCPQIGTEWHEENGGGWIFEGWGLLLWRPRADWKTCFDMWPLTPIIQLDLTALHSQTPTVCVNLP